MATVPGVPTITSATATSQTNGVAQFSIAYSPPASDGGSPITSYYVKRGLTGTVVTTANPYTFTDTLVGTPYNADYRFALAAVNGIGVGPYTSNAIVSASTDKYTVTVQSPTVLRIAFNAATMPAPPKSVSSTFAGDARNPNTWWRDGVGAPVFATSVTEINDYTFDLTFPVSSTAIFLSTAIPGAGNALQLTDNSTFQVIAVYRNLAPTAPVLLTATPSNGSVTISFTPSTADSSYPVTYYEYSLDGGSTFYTATVVSNSFTVSGLTNGTSYSFILRALNTLGSFTGGGVYTATSVWSNSLVATPGDVPSFPTITTIVPTSTSLTVSYNAPSSDGGSPITSYAYSVNGSLDYVDVGLVNPFVISFLTPGITYSLRLRANNAVGPGAWSAPVNGTTLDVPTAPTITTVTPGSSKLTVAYTVPSSDGGSPITDYQYSTNGGSVFASAGLLNPFVITGLSNGTTYNVLLRAVTANGVGYWSSPVAGTPVGVPTAPLITNIVPSATTLQVTYTAPSNDGGTPITDYEYSLDNLSYTSAGLSNPFTITGLSSNQGYLVRLRALNAAGAGSISSPAYTQTTAFYVVYAVSDRVVRVKFDTAAFTAPPVHVSSTGYQDALNPRTWLISQASKDPAVGPDDYYPLTTLSVLSTDAYTYDIFTLENFARATGPLLHMLIPNGLKLEDGSVVYPGLWTEAESYFNGSIQSSDASANRKTAQRGFSTRDLANVATPYDDLVGGTLVINDAGDYASVSGEQFIRKLVLRRLISKKGDFFHLPNYGAGLGVKSTFSTANLRMMAKDIEMQVLLEPEVEQAKATLTYQASDGTLTIQVRARMRSTGQVSSISLNLPAGSIQF